ncbi:MAG: xanthine dehydrogenase subunit D, partial [Actinomycetota bacterium]
MSGGAVDAACRAVRDELLGIVASENGLDPARLTIDGTDIVEVGGSFRRAVAEAARGKRLDETREYDLQPTEDLVENGQGH